MMLRVGNVISGMRSMGSRLTATKPMAMMARVSITVKTGRRMEKPEMFICRLRSFPPACRPSGRMMRPSVSSR